MTDLATLGLRIDSSEVKTGVERLDTLTDAGARAERSTKGLTTASGLLRQAFTALGAASVTATITSATQATIKFQNAMAEVSTLVDETTFSIKAMTDAALAQSKAFGSTATEQAKAQYQIISAGATSAASAIDTLTAANRLAVGGVTTVSIAADGLTSVLNAYGPAAGTAAQVSDAMFVAMRAGKTTIGELSANLGKVAPLAASAGVSFDELVASVSALTKGGIATAEAVTGVRAILASVSKPTDEASKLAEKLGLSFNSAAIQSKGFKGFLDEIVAKTGGNSDALAELFGGVEALVPILALAGQAGVDLTNILQDMANKGGATEAAFNKMAESPGFKFNQLVAAMSAEGIKLGTAILTVMVPAMTFLTENLDTIIDVAGAATAGFIAFHGALAVGAVARYVATLIALERALGAATLAQAAAGVAAKALQAAFGLAAIGARGLLASLGPIGLALAVAAGAYYLLSERTQEATKASDQYLRQTAALEQIQNKTKTATDALASATGKARDEAIRNTKALRDETAEYLRNAKAALAAAQAKAREVQQKADAGTRSAIGGPAYMTTYMLGKGARETVQPNADAAQAAKNVKAAQAEFDRLSKIIADAEKPIAAVTGGMVNLGDETKKATDKANSALEQSKTYLEGLRSDLARIGLTDSGIKRLEIEAAAAKAPTKELAAEIRSVGAALLSAQNTQTAIEFARALADEAAAIGKTEKELRAMAVAKAIAATSSKEAIALIEREAAAREKAIASQKATDFIRNVIEPLEFEASLLGKNAVERAKATAERDLETAGIERGTEAWSRYYDAIVKPAEVEFNNENLREYLGLLDDVADRTRDAAQAMSDAFGSVGGAIGALAETFATYAADREAAAQRVAELEAKNQEGTLAYVRAKNAQDALQIKHYSDIAGAAKGLFKEHSIGYKAMATAEKILAAVQLARALKAIFLRGAETAATVTGAAIETGAVVAAEGVKTATAVAGAAVRTPLKVTEGAASIFASLGPFGFPVVAAMIAVMAALGFGGGGGGSSAPSMPTPEDLQAGAGTGSVLGDPKAQSESIKNSLEIMASNSNSDLEYTNQMLRALKSIDSGISNLAGTIARQIQVDGSLFNTSSLNLGQTGSPGFLGLFSSSTTRTLYDAGITLAASTVGDILAQGISGSTYQVVQQVRRTSGFLGIGGGTRTSYQTSNGALGSDITGAIVDVIASLRVGLVEGADIIGLEGAQAILDSFQVNLGQLSFQGLTGAEIESQLNAIFSRVGDDMAGALYPALAEMQLVGEGLFETFTRVARQYQVVDMALTSIGMEFGAVGIGSVAARDALVQLFGTLDEFASQTEFFADKFLTDAERIAPIADAVRAEMERLGLAGVTTRDQFKEAVLGLDLTTTAGREMFAALMAVAPAFSKVADYAEETARATTDALQETIDKFTSFAQSLRKYRDTLYAVDASGANAYALARAKFLATSALATNGDPTALGNLEGVSRSFLEASRNSASSYAQYQRDVAAVAGAVDRGIFAAEETADYAQLQIDALNASLGILTSIDDGIGTVAAILAGQPVNVSAPVPLPPSAPVQQPITGGSPRSPELINELQAMRDESKAQALALASSMSTIARLAERWDADGLFVRGADPDAPLVVEVTS